MTQTVIRTFILLILVTDPFGTVPLFVSAMAQVPRAGTSGSPAKTGY